MFHARSSDQRLGLLIVGSSASQTDLAHFVRESGILMVRAVNIVAVWGVTGSAVARLGVAATAAHQALLSFQQLQAIAMGAFTTGDEISSRSVLKINAP